MAEKGWLDTIFCQNKNSKVKDMENGVLPNGEKDPFGVVTKENMADFIKEMKKQGLTDEEASQMAAAKIADSKPKSRMYYKIQTSRNMGGAKKVDLASNVAVIDNKRLFVVQKSYEEIHKVCSNNSAQCCNKHTSALDAPAF